MGGILQFESLKVLFLEIDFLELLHFPFLGSGESTRATEGAFFLWFFPLLGSSRSVWLFLARGDAKWALVAVGWQLEGGVIETQGRFDLAFVAELSVSKTFTQTSGSISDDANILRRTAMIDEMASEPLVFTLERNVAHKDRTRRVSTRRWSTRCFAGAGGHIGSHMFVAHHDGRIGFIDKVHCPVCPLHTDERHIGVASTQAWVELLLNERPFPTHFWRCCCERSESNALDDLLSLVLLF